MKKSILTSIALCVFGFGSFAQLTTTAAHNVKIVAQDVMDIAFTSPGDVTFTFDTPTKYDNGITNATAAELKVKSTKNWKVQVKADQASFTAATSGNTENITADKLEINAGTSITLSTTDATIASGNKGGNGVSGNTFTVSYKLNPGYITADSYSIPVTYTISAQ